MSKRIIWGQPTNINLPTLDLVKVQRDSFADFLETGIGEVLQEVTPIDDFTGKNFTLTLGKHSFGKPKHDPEQAVEKGLTYDIPLKVEVTVLNKQT
ncbi:hypothetical protein HY024_04835, partial [Candidatus Curtissbacteria bacterium]|nr:hypothetical protein [Candidatus Curtissbacteria bacterium]